MPPPFGSLRKGSWHTAGVTEGFLSYYRKSPVTAPPCHPLSRKGALGRRAESSRPTADRWGQRPLHKPSGPTQALRPSRRAGQKPPLPSQMPPLGIRAAARVPSTQHKNRPGVGRFHTFFGNYRTILLKTEIMNTTTSEAGGCHYAGIALCSSRTRTTRNTVCQLRRGRYLWPVSRLGEPFLNHSPRSSPYA